MKNVKGKNFLNFIFIVFSIFFFSSSDYAQAGTAVPCGQDCYYMGSSQCCPKQSGLNQGVMECELSCSYVPPVPVYTFCGTVCEFGTCRPGVVSNLDGGIGGGGGKPCPDETEVCVSPGTSCKFGGCVSWGGGASCGGIRDCKLDSACGSVNVGYTISTADPHSTVPASTMQCNSSRQCVSNGGGASCFGRPDICTSLEKKCNTTTKQCVPGGNGASCSLNTDCGASPAQCDKSRQCKPNGGGASCYENGDCANLALSCNPTTKQCVPGGTGKSCTVDGDCLPRCNNGTCDANATTGNVCESDDECKGRCDGTSCVIPTCTTKTWYKFKIGDTCYNSNGKVSSCNQSTSRSCYPELTSQNCDSNNDCAPSNALGCEDGQCKKGGTGNSCTNAFDCGTYCTTDGRCVLGVSSSSAQENGNPVSCDPDNSSSCLAKCTSTGTCSYSGTGKVCGNNNDCKFSCNSSNQCAQGGGGPECRQGHNEDCVYHCNAAQQCDKNGTGKECNITNGDADCQYRCRDATGVSAISNQCVQGGKGALCTSSDDCTTKCTAYFTCSPYGTGIPCNSASGDVVCAKSCSFSGQCDVQATWTPITGDWDGLGGKTTVGVYDNAAVAPAFHLRNINTTNATDIDIHLNNITDNKNNIPITGDWDGNGKIEIGFYNQMAETGQSNFFLAENDSNNATITQFSFGGTGGAFIPITGDWDGNNITDVGVYDPLTSVFHLRGVNGVDNAFGYGEPGRGWLPIAGDWNGDKRATIGLYDPTTGGFYLKNSNTSGNADASFNFGAAYSGWLPIAGDWDGNGTTTIGVFDPSTSRFYLKNSNSGGYADISFKFKEIINCNDSSVCPVQQYQHLDCVNQTCKYVTDSVAKIDSCVGEGYECCAEGDSRVCPACGVQNCTSAGIWEPCPSVHYEDVDGVCTCVPTEGGDSCGEALPTVSKMKVNDEPCGLSGSATDYFSWKYSGPSGFTQSKFKFQVAGSLSDFDSTSKILIDKTIEFSGSNNGSNSQTAKVSLQSGCDTSSTSKVCNLSFNNDYYWRVKVAYKNLAGKDVFSKWYYFNIDGGSINTNEAEKFSTLDHPAPFVQFAYSPEAPKVNELIGLYDYGSMCYKLGKMVSCKNTGAVYKWSGTGVKALPTDQTRASVTLTNTTPRNVSLTICEDSSCSVACTNSTLIDVSGKASVPKWQEISPF